jgi:phosphoserine phosphatase RsbU/P
VSRKLPSHLKIHSEETTSEMQPANPAPGDFNLDRLLKAFSNATGWKAIARKEGMRPHLATVAEPGQPVLPLHSRMQLVSTAPIDGLLDLQDVPTFLGASENEAWELMQQIDTLLQRLDEAEATIARQEAQLASSLGVSIRQDESELLASRMVESLHRAVEQTGSDAAALYLLDDSTSTLKMRCCWGLPAAALSQPPRPLRGAMADLEALMGNAVLLENTALAREWNCPEDYPAAMCVPIGSPTMPQGTLWLWSSHVRDFTSGDIDHGKAAADKILVDIERSVLADEVLRRRGLDRQVESASLVQSSRLPSAQPLHADYAIDGWTFQGQALGGNFHTWTVNRHGQICAALGAAANHGAAGALVAMSLQTVVETCWNSPHKPAQIMRKANDLLWGAEDGDWRSSLCYFTLNPQTGELIYSTSGTIQAFLFGSRGFRMLPCTSTMLAAQPDTRFETQQLVLEGGELLLVVSADVVASTTRGGLTQQGLLDIVRRMQDEPVDVIVDHLRRILPMAKVDEPADYDRSLLLFRRQF